MSILRRLAMIAGIALSSLAHAQTTHDHAAHEHSPPVHDGQVSPHIPPDPPAQVLEPMSAEQMHSMMEMDDSARFGSIVFDRAEWRDEEDAAAWSASARYGGDANKLVIKSEGEVQPDRDALRSEVLWDRVVSAWWNLQTGLRVDSGSDPTRTWAAIGVEGIAPYWIDVDAMFYAADEGRTALRLELRYDLRLTQRLILQPQLETNAYGKSDPERNLGSGWSDLEAGLRLRYEFRREFAPYVGVEWTSLFGKTADYARAAGEDPDVVQFVAGLRIWF